MSQPSGSRWTSTAIPGIIDLNSQIWHHTAAAGWQQLPGAAREIAVYSTSRVVIAAHGCSAYKWTGSDWQQLEAEQRACDAAIDGRYVYATDLQRAIYRIKA